MATNSASKKPVFTFIWKIKNFSYSWHNENRYLNSANFTVDSLKNTTWHLSIASRGEFFDDKSVNVYLQRSDNHESRILINFNFALLLTDGSLQHSKKIRQWFGKDRGYGILDFIDREELFGNQRAMFLPSDTLTLHCYIWSTKAAPKRLAQCFLATEIGVQQSSFIWSIKNFSSFLQKLEPITVYKYSSRGEKKLFTLNLLLESVQSDSNISIDFINTLEDMDKYGYLAKSKVSLLDANGTTINLEQNEHLFLHNGEHWKTSSLITMSKLMKHKDLYLPNGELVLQIDCSISHGVVMNELEKIIYGPFSTYTENLLTETAKQHTAQTQNPILELEDSQEQTFSSKETQTEIPIVKEMNSIVDVQQPNLTSSPSELGSSSNSLRNDLQCLYEEATLYDFTVQNFFKRLDYLFFIQW
ncbi:TD and POZ domain-containing protein 3 [Caerostris darwini]|uniref:TD and POZ domain-containing protein 3 n=1 Tax=Caerostris darwini TaxID=1538125 RepID=A0AAV4RRD9_9ARAC|nr:TD and POZ domain-containing protein 3 [Caerostris darwini]